MNLNEQRAEPGQETLSSLKAKEQQDKLDAELKRIIAKEQAKDILGFQEKMVAESDRLAEKYGKTALNNSRLYHLLVGSTKISSTTLDDRDDINGEVEAFLRGLEE